MVGIGLGLARHLLRNDTKLTVVATSRTPDKTRPDVLDGEDEALSKRLRVLNIDVTKEDTINSARKQVEDEFGIGSIKCLFNMSGIVSSLHRTLANLVISRENGDKGVIRGRPRNIQSQYTGSAIRHETFPPTLSSRTPPHDDAFPTRFQYHYDHVRARRIHFRQQTRRMVLVPLLQSSTKSNHKNT